MLFNYPTRNIFKIILWVFSLHVCVPVYLYRVCSFPRRSEDSMHLPGLEFLMEGRELLSGTKN